VRITGRQLRDYLEQSARYFRDATSAVAPGTVDPAVPGFNFDIIAGADYTLDLSRPTGTRVVRLEVRGRPVGDADSFTLALNNYRQSGGGGFAMLRDAPVVYDRQEDIRQLLIDEVRRRRAVEPAEYATRNWRIEPAEAVGMAYGSMHVLEGTSATPGPTMPRRLRLIAINDFHGAMEPRRDSAGTWRGGAVALAAEVARARAECVAPACLSLLLDGGDQFQGTAASNLAFGRPVVAFFNQLGLAAAALGNHEFDWGQDTLRQRMLDAAYPILGANVRNDDGSDVPWIKDDTLLTLGALRVGVIGLATVETARTTRVANVAGLRFVEPASVVDERARALRARGADVVIVVAHAGAFCDRREMRNCGGEIIALALQLTERIDAIVSGHTHSPVATTVRGTPIVQAWSRGTAIGVVDLPIGAGETPAVELRNVLSDSVTRQDSVVTRIVRDATESLRERMGRPIARVATRMASGINGTLGNLIADAQRAAGEGDVAIMNSGGVRAPLDSGMATFGALFEVHPFANTLVRLTVTGRDLRAYLERVVGHAPIRAHLSGAEVRYDPARPEGERIIDVRLSGDRRLDDAASYRLIMTDFMSTGGDGLNLAGTALRTESLPIVDLDALIDYLRAQPAPVRAPTDRRLISISP
jgi:2',3'-cyclic-nucleotide 2'-phosphodiesterase (5'-nucleotidase family)